MERLTFEGLFCDISQCSDTPGGSFCEDGMCSQRATWERLKTYEDTGLTPEQIQEAVDLLNSNFYDADIPKELISWVERCTWHVRKCHELRTQLDKYEALGAVDELTEMKDRAALVGERFTSGEQQLKFREMTGQEAYFEFLRLVNDMPAADVAPVRHGRWYDVGSLSCRCSMCGCKNDRVRPYCPVCGAKMDGGQDAEDHD